MYFFYVPGLVTLIRLMLRRTLVLFVLYSSFFRSHEDTKAQSCTKKKYKKK